MSTKVHMESASTLAVRRGVIADMRCAPALVGDWNCVHADDPRIDLRRLEEVSAHDPMSSHFERMLPAFIELEQAAPTRRQLSDGVAVSLSRINRIYIKAFPAELSDMVVKVVVVGDALKPDNRCDHIPVGARLSRRRPRHPGMQPPLAASLCRSSAFIQAASAMDGFIPDSMSPLARIEAYETVLREAARSASRMMEEKRRLPAAIIAQIALGFLRASRRGDGVGVSRGVCATCDLVTFVNIGRTDVVDSIGLLEYVRTQSIEAVEQERRYIAESLTPEGQKRQKVEGPRARWMAWRLRRPGKRCVGSTCDGLEARDSAEVCAALKARWVPVCTDKPIGEDSVDRFLTFVVSVLVGLNWGISADVVEGVIFRTTGSMPGPDGAPYAAWRAVAHRVALPIHAGGGGVLRGSWSSRWAPLSPRLPSCRRRPRWAWWSASLRRSRPHARWH